MIDMSIFRIFANKNLDIGKKSPGNVARIRKPFTAYQFKMKRTINIVGTETKIFKHINVYQSLNWERINIKDGKGI